MSRKLGYLEDLMIRRCLAKTYHNFNITAVYSVPLSIHQVTLALKLLLLEQPMLISVIDFPAGTLRLIDTDVYVDDLIEVNRDDTELDSSFLTRLDKIRFIGNMDTKLHYKILLSNGNRHMTFITDHALYDGISGQKFHSLFFNALIRIDESEPVSKSQIILSKEEIAAKLQDYKLPVDVGDLLKLDSIPQIKIKHPIEDLNSDIKRWPAYRLASYDYRPLYYRVNIPSDDLSKILKSLKPHKVSLTNYFVVVFMLTVIKPIMNKYKLDKNESSDLYMPIKIAMNGRRHFPGNEAPIFGNILYPGNDIPFPLSVLNSIDANDKQAILKLALENSHLLNYQIQNLDHVIQEQYLKLMEKTPKELESFFTGAIGKSKPDGIKNSNLGLVKFEANEKFQVLDLVFCQSVGMTAGDFVMNMISSPAGGLNFCLGIHEGTCDSNTLQKYLDNLKSHLNF